MTSTEPLRTTQTDSTGPAPCAKIALPRGGDLGLGHRGNPGQLIHVHHVETADVIRGSPRCLPRARRPASGGARRRPRTAKARCSSSTAVGRPRNLAR